MGTGLFKLSDTPHASSHQPGGDDAMAVDQPASVASLRTLGTGPQQAAAGNDPRLADARVGSSLRLPNGDVLAIGPIADGQVWVRQGNALVGISWPPSTPPSGVATMAATPQTCSTGAGVHVVWSGVPAPTVTDWISWYAAGAPNTSWQPNWIYANSGAQTAGPTPTTAGSHDFIAPATPGIYELRLLSAGGFTTLATSNAVIVS